jgi:hypothetical protein
MSDEDPEAQAYVWYVWNCPECGEVQECEPPDVEPNGDDIECRVCSAMVTVHGT